MSGSPKYSAPSFAETILGLFAVAAEGCLAVGVGACKAGEAAYRSARLQVVRANTAAQARRLAEAAVAFSTTAAGSFAAQPLGALRARLQQAVTEAGSAQNHGVLDRLNGELQGLDRRLREICADAEAARFSQHLKHEEAVVARLKKRMELLDRAASTSFDAPGLRAVEAALQLAETALQKKKLDEAGRLAQETITRLEHHQASVEKTRAERQAKLEEARHAAVGRAQSLGEDVVVARWSADAVRRLIERSEQIGAAAAASLVAGDTNVDLTGAVGDAEAESAAVVAEADRLVERSHEIESKERRRQYVVNSMVEIMQGMGFVVQEGFPTLEHPTAPNSATMIHARRIGGGALAVSVPQEGDVWYDVSGYPARLETAVDGATTASCDEAEEQLQQMHAMLEEKFGVQMSPLWWDGKDPQRIAKQADRLPATQRNDRRHPNGA